jgi:hypothetical protein
LSLRVAPPTLFDLIEEPFDQGTVGLTGAEL